MEGLKANLRELRRNFSRGHIDGWRQGDLNQREHCELHGLPLKRLAAEALRRIVGHYAIEDGIRGCTAQER